MCQHHSSTCAAGLLMIASLTTVSCGGRSESTWRGSTFDSAGVTVVVNPPTGIWTPEEAWRVTEEMSVGTATGDPDLEFGSLSGLAVGSDGAMYALDRQARQIRVLDSAGIPVRRIGRSGSGPGELSAAASAVLVGPGDTLFVPDPAAGRLNLFLSSGEIEDARSLPPHTGALIQWATDPTGRLIYRDYSPSWDGLLTYAVTGHQADTILEFKYERLVPKLHRDPVTGAPGITTNPLTALPIWCELADGRIASGITDQYRVVVRTADGTVDRVITRRAGREVLNGSAAASIRKLWLRRQAFQVAPEAAERISLELPDSFPAFAALAAGPEQTLWVQRIADVSAMDPEGLGAISYALLGSRAWDVFDREGRYLGVVEFPYQVRLLSTHGRRMYAVARGPYDEDRIVRFRVDMGPPPS